MTEKSRFFSALFSAKEGQRVSNVKFFPGEKIRSKENIYRQAADALIQHKMGIAKASKTAGEDLPQIHVKDFLSP